MPPKDDWSGEDRRRILERRRQARQDERDKQAEAAAAAGAPAPERRAERGKTERRREQICFVCRDQFVPTANGQTICEKCHLDGVRGGGRNGWRAPRF